IQARHMSEWEGLAAIEGRNWRDIADMALAKAHDAPRLARTARQRDVLSFGADLPGQPDHRRNSADRPAHRDRDSRRNSDNRPPGRRMSWKRVNPAPPN